ncbi:MAG: hypothetical protein MUC65_09245 [Pontiellaceae bacterium]|nr:hypothetical protein [Pontiellaceae bacterium]
MTKLLIVARPLFPSLAGVKDLRKTAMKYEELNIGKQPVCFTTLECPDAPALFSLLKTTNPSQPTASPYADLRSFLFSTPSRRGCAETLA